MEDVNRFGGHSVTPEPEQLEVVELSRPGESGQLLSTEEDIEALAEEAGRLEALHDELRAELVGQDQQPHQ